MFVGFFLNLGFYTLYILFLSRLLIGQGFDVLNYYFNQSAAVAPEKAVLFLSVDSFYVLLIGCVGGYFLIKMMDKKWGGSQLRYGGLFAQTLCLLWGCLCLITALVSVVDVFIVQYEASKFLYGVKLSVFLLYSFLLIVFPLCEMRKQKKQRWRRLGVFWFSLAMVSSSVVMGVYQSIFPSERIEEIQQDYKKLNRLIILQRIFQDYHQKFGHFPQSFSQVQAGLTVWGFYSPEVIDYQRYDRNTYHMKGGIGIKNVPESLKHVFKEYDSTGKHLILRAGNKTIAQLPFFIGTFPFMIEFR